jgi:hypothetical protein
MRWFSEITLPRKERGYDGKELGYYGKYEPVEAFQRAEKNKGAPKYCHGIWISMQFVDSK